MRRLGGITTRPEPPGTEAFGALPVCRLPRDEPGLLRGCESPILPPPPGTLLDFVIAGTTCNGFTQQTLFPLLDKQLTVSVCI